MLEESEAPEKLDIPEKSEKIARLEATMSIPLVL